MKLAYEDSFTYKVLQRVESIRDNAILRQDLADLGSPRQISRALKTLVKLKKLVRLGYGVYGKLAENRGERYLKGGLLFTAREILDKLGVSWELSQSEKDYNTGRSTQVPVSPCTIIKSNFTRRIRYKNMEFKIAKQVS